MYFTNISYEELQQFHNKIKVTFQTSLQNIQNTHLFEIEDMGDLLRIFPLFYTDKIESSNKNDIVMENKCIICENTDDTILYFLADEDIQVLDLNYSYYSDFVNYIVFYLFDAVNGNNLYNVTVNASFKEDDIVVKELELNSDRKGIVYIDTSKFSFDEANITFSITGITKTFNWSSE